MNKFTYTNEDFNNLKGIFNSKLGSKIGFFNDKTPGIINGLYISSYRLNNNKQDLSKYFIPIQIKFSELEFIGISIGNNKHGLSLGERLAALSDIYEEIYRIFGHPTVFYETKMENEEVLNLDWIFIKETKNLIMFDNFENISGTLNDRVIRTIEKNTGLPYELFPLVNHDLDNYLKHKHGKDERTIGKSKYELEQKIKIKQLIKN